jgi:bifunctional DNA-binding transcriptional regulator/antitoxin component of YhaV-PrlF toxin-antitoxin module
LRRKGFFALSPNLYFRSAKVKDMAKVSSKNQVTLPVEAMRQAGLRPGDEVTVRPIGNGAVIVAARGSRIRRHAGIATGLYESGELDRLRDEWQR